MIIPLNKTTSYYRFDMNEDERMSAITINAISGISFFRSKKLRHFFQTSFFSKAKWHSQFFVSYSERAHPISYLTVGLRRKCHKNKEKNSKEIKVRG